MSEGCFTTEYRVSQGDYFLILIPPLGNNLSISFCVKTVRAKKSYVSVLVTAIQQVDRTNLHEFNSGLSVTKHKLICILTNGEVSALCKNTKG